MPKGKYRVLRFRKRLLLMSVGGLYICLYYLRQSRSSVSRSVAVFLQIGQTLHSDYIGKCLGNVIEAQRGGFGFDFDFTLYLSITDEVADAEAVISTFSRGIPKENMRISRVRNAGFDTGPFLHQLDGQGVQQHDYFLKMHSKSDLVWLERGIESLCGTPRQVISVLRAFDSLSTVDIVAPMGLAYAMQSSKDSLFPLVREKYYQTSEIASTFDDATIVKMQELCLMMGTTACSGFDKYLLSIVSGSMFWARNSEIFYKFLPSLLALDDFKKSLKSTYVDNGGFEHALERLVPSMVRFRGRDIVQIQPAPKPIALFFPQFHAIPENDKNWGKGFTEWNLLNQTDFIAKVPLSYAEGGLGYYDLLEKRIRTRQAQIAKRYGIFGFCYYHYWFSGIGAPESHKVMYRAIEKILLDGEPDLPFMLSWANEPWVRTWTGITEANGILISQEYGNPEEWKAHFEYLLRFFRHPNYIKVRNKPVFAIYRLGHLKEKLEPMILLWRTLAREYGLAGIHVVETINHFSLGGIDPRFEAGDLIDSSYHFNLVNAASADNLPSMSTKSKPQYWGIHNGFDRRPRTGDYSYPILKTPNEFVMWYKTMIERLGQLPGRQIDQGFNFVCAWNEWNEQAVLEPDTRWRFQALEGISKILQEVPVQPIF